MGAAAGGALAACWLWVLVTGLPFAARTALALCRGRQRPAGGIRPPRPVRVVVLLVLGAQGLAVTAAGAASAGTLPPSPAPAPAARVAPPSALVPALLAGLPLPGRTTGAVQAPTPPHHRAAPHGPAGGRRVGGEVVVAEGDSLWSIAARALAPPGADDATVAACTARLRAANADLLGDDPDLIFPGTRLVLPSAAPTRKEHR